jgi:hypothetical protein
VDNIALKSQPPKEFQVKMIRLGCSLNKRFIPLFIIILVLESCLGADVHFDLLTIPGRSLTWNLRGYSKDISHKWSFSKAL